MRPIRYRGSATPEEHGKLGQPCSINYLCQKVCRTSLRRKRARQRAVRTEGKMSPSAWTHQDSLRCSCALISSIWSWEPMVMRAHPMVTTSLPSTLPSRKHTLKQHTPLKRHLVTAHTPSAWSLPVARSQVPWSCDEPRPQLLQPTATRPGLACLTAVASLF